MPEDSRKAQEELLEVLEEMDRRDRQNQFYHMFPSEEEHWRGEVFHPRKAYPKHMAFITATSLYREVGFMASNRSGKTHAGAFNVSVWLTGLYPDWWTGKRFPGPVNVWVAGVTNETTRDIIQHKLLGDVVSLDGRKHLTGTGMIPGKFLSDPTWKTGITDCLDTIWVQHTSGGRSKLGMKSYNQGRDVFQGTAQHVIWLDEEPDDLGVATECLTRTATTGGILLYTFTPLKGVSDVAMRFLPGDAGTEDLSVDDIVGIDAGRCVIFCGWDAVPHLDQKTKSDLLSAYPEHERKARTEGIPGLGDGAIYPISTEQIVCKPFQIPDHWARAYGMDVGWNCTAVVWLAWDRESDVVYVYTEHYRGQQPPTVHKEAIVARGDWIPGVIDPASGSSGQADGKQLLVDYRALGLNLKPANNAVESGILQVYNRLVSGRLKIFSTCQNLLSEYKFYRRKDGKVVKVRDHALDALRYGIVSGLRVAKTKTVMEYNAPVTTTAAGY